MDTGAPQKEWRRHARMFKLKPRAVCLGLLHIHLQLRAASTAFALAGSGHQLHSAALGLPRPAALLRSVSVTALRRLPPAQALYLRGGSRQQTSRAMSSGMYARLHVYQNGCRLAPVAWVRAL